MQTYNSKQWGPGTACSGCLVQQGRGSCKGAEQTQGGNWEELQAQSTGHICNEEPNTPVRGADQ